MIGFVAGRPSIYTDELALSICKKLALGESLRKICEADGMPARDTVLTWAMDPKHPFAARYAAAREAQAESLADEICDIADEAVDGESAQAARVRIDARKWCAAKLRPKRYGEKLALDDEGSKRPALAVLTLESLKAALSADQFLELKGLLAPKTETEVKNESGAAIPGVAHEEARDDGLGADRVPGTAPSAGDRHDREARAGDSRAHDGAAHGAGDPFA